MWKFKISKNLQNDMGKYFSFVALQKFCFTNSKIKTRNFLFLFFFLQSIRFVYFFVCQTLIINKFGRSVMDKNKESIKIYIFELDLITCTSMRIMLGKTIGYIIHELCKSYLFQFWIRFLWKTCINCIYSCESQETILI